MRVKYDSIFKALRSAPPSSRGYTEPSSDTIIQVPIPGDEHLIIQWLMVVSGSYERTVMGN